MPPFAMKSYYFEIASLVTSVVKGDAENPNRATIAIDFQEMKPEDRQAIGDFVRDLRKFRDILDAQSRGRRNRQQKDATHRESADQQADFEKRLKTVWHGNDSSVGIGLGYRSYVGGANDLIATITAD